MPALAVGLLVWLACSIALAVAFALGAAIGRRRAWEDAGDAPQPPGLRLDRRAAEPLEASAPERG